jgi:hypothetical protein
VKAHSILCAYEELTWRATYIPAEGGGGELKKKDVGKHETCFENALPRVTRFSRQTTAILMPRLS